MIRVYKRWGFGDVLNLGLLERILRQDKHSSERELSGYQGGLSGISLPKKMELTLSTLAIFSGALWAGKAVCCLLDCILIG